jgi:hypothetical protein
MLLLLAIAILSAWLFDQVRKREGRSGRDDPPPND